MLNKKLILILVTLLTLFITNVACAQNFNVVRNDDAATTIQSNNLTTSKISTDNKGRLFSPIPSTTGGYTKYTFGALVGTVQTVKGTAATLGGWQILNSAATICYLQIFDVATATTVTLGTTVPDQSFGWPAGAAANIPATLPGIAFANGIKIAATTTRAGSTPCGTGMDVNLFYK